MRLRIPSTLARGAPVADSTCFVWRDHEYRTATLHCPPIDYQLD